MLNIHGSLLPRWRGAAPINYAILNDDLITGITLMRIKPKKLVKSIWFCLTIN